MEDEVSRVSEISVEALHQRKIMLEEELSSLTRMLNRPRKSQSVPGVNIIHSVPHSRSLHARSQRGATSILEEPPFSVFSPLPPLPPPFCSQHAPVSSTNVWVQTTPNKPARDVHHGNQAIIGQVSNTRTSQHHEVNVNVQTSGKVTSEISSSSHNSIGLKTIDEWVEAVCLHNSQQASKNNSRSTLYQLPSQLHHERDNHRGSTEVELLYASNIDPRYGEREMDCLDRDRMKKRNSSMKVTGVDSRSFFSHRSLTGSTEVELPNVPRQLGEQRLVNDHYLAGLDQRTPGVVEQSFYHQRNEEFDQQLRDHLRTEQFKSNLGFNCASASYQKPQISVGPGSTKVELQNAQPFQNICGGEYGRKIDQLDQRQVLHGKPVLGHEREIRFPRMDAPNYQTFGQSCDQQGYTNDGHPFKDQQRNFASDNWTSNRDMTDDFQNLHGGNFRNNRNDISQPKPLSAIENPQSQIEANNAMMTKLVSRQVLGKDLPEFSGQISKWLSFHNDYKESTDTCKFTDRENIRRLRKCLKGEAETLVRSLLISATSAETIISVLKRRFGRPDDIIRLEIQTVKDIPSPTEDDPKSIINFATAVLNLVITLETLKKPNHLRNPVLLDELQEKLPTTFNLLWSEHIVNREDDLTLRDLAEWLDRRAEAASRRTTLKVQNVESTQKLKCKARINTINTISQDNIAVSSCYNCHGACKSLESCEAFEKLDVHKRWEIVKKNKLCFFCLARNHEFRDCVRKVECNIKGCKRFHHKLLHTKGTKVGIITANFKPHVTKLRIVPVILYGKSIEIKTFTLLDPGSTSTLMSEHLRSLLKLDGPNAPLLLEWMNGDIAVEDESKIVDTRIQGTYDGAKIYDLFNVRTVKNLPLHKQTIDRELLAKKWPYLRTIDFEGYENAQPELLIGENNGLLIATRQLVHDKWNTPIASKTWLGWIISGNEGKSNDSATIKIFTVRDVEQDELHRLVKSSFTLEEEGVINQTLSRSREDDRAIQILESNSTLTDNRWQTGLLWRDEQVVLPESRRNALLRLFILEKKLDKQTELRQRYNKIISEYIEKKFLRKCEKNDTTLTRSWYLPHFPVLYPLKPGKVRIVFDAAAKSNGFSLNDYLMPGPDFLKPLISVLFKFRHGKIGILGYIKDMFHRIKMKPADAKCQKIPWRGDSRTSEPDEYELDVLSFGANCSPCTAIYIKDKNAERFQQEFPEAVDAILNKHYMDDYLDSIESEDKAIQMIKDVTYVHGQGSFEIRNWISSSKSVIQAIPEHLRRNSAAKVNFDYKNLQDRVLGILWEASDDVFTFSLDFAKIDKRLISGEKKPTKREVLSIIHSVFNPLGFVAHLMIIGEMINKNIWATGIDWDDLILKKQWRASQYLADLFWQRWLKEFLPTLTKRTKWLLSNRKPKVGDLVLIADPDEKREIWPKGIITAVFPGIDDEIRVVDVTTATGTYRRPMHKICLLETTVAGGGCTEK